MSQPLPPKKEVALALLERSSVHLHLDPRIDGVVVPPWFKKQPQLVLQVGLNMPVPIPDLRLDDDGMSCTLSFNRSPFFCVVPWTSVFAIVGDDGRGMVWPDDVPPEVAQQSSRAAADARKEPGKRPTAAEDPRAPGAPSPAAQLVIAPAPAASAKPAEARAPEDAPSSKGKRPRKKPQLAPAPPPEAAETAPAPQRLAPAPAESAARSPRSPLRHPQPASKPEPRKPKRELPPYLRVVK